MSYNDDDDDEEVIIGGDDDDNPFTGSTNSDEVPKIINYKNFFQPQITQCNELNENFKVESHECKLQFRLLSDFLPPTLQILCGFYSSPILINVSLVFKEASWNSPLIQFSATHPIFNHNYVGRPLVLDTIRRFFTNSYVPKKQYKCSSLFLTTLQMANIKSDTHPLIFLILEIIDSFYDIQNHCCICGSQLPYSVIKPTICSKKLCQVGFNEIGVGSSVAQEIIRDPYSADLLLSLYSCSFHDERYLNPTPPKEILTNSKRLFNSLPSMKTIATFCKNDTDIIKKYGKETLDLLRWVILSNKAQLIHLPEELKLNSIPFKNQFMALMAAPEAEEIFQKKKYKVNSGSLFMYHGSGGDRWHSIVRNGLMNMSNKDCIHGKAYGPGIYLAERYRTSMDYITMVKNLYKNSLWPNNLTCLALCEVVPNKSFQNFGGIATLQDEGALIVRFLFPITDEYVGGDDDDDYDYYYDEERKKTPASLKIPRLSDVLRFLENAAKSGKVDNPYGDDN